MQPKGLFDDDPKLGRSKRQSRSYDMARRLADAVHRSGLATGPIDAAKWQEHFDLLLERHPYDEADAVLEWYCRNMGKEYVPEAYSGRGFLKKYPQIKAQADADQPVPVVKISTEAVKIAAELRSLNWPAGSDLHLPVVAQVSIDQYTPFYNKVVGLRASQRDNKGAGITTGPLLLFVNYLLDTRRLCRAPEFVREWLKHIRGKVEGWSNWTGAVSSIAFRPDSPWLLRLGRSWSYEYFHRSEYWDKLMEAIAQL